MSHAVVAALVLLLTGCAPGFADRVKLYEACNRSLLFGGTKAVALAQQVHGEARDQAVVDALTKLQTSEVPADVTTTCGTALAAAREAIRTGRAK